MNIVGKDIRWMRRIEFVPHNTTLADAPRRFQKLKSLGLVELDAEGGPCLTTLGRRVLNEKSS